MLSTTTEQPVSLLTDEHRAQFERDGYCVVNGLFTTEEIDEIEEFFEEYKTKGYKNYDGGTTIDEVDRSKSQVRALHPHRYDERALDWALNENVMAALQDLFGGNEPLLAQTMYYFKPPGTTGQPMHQDDFYLLTKPHRCMAAWTPIDDAEVENGCLFMVPGSHKRGLKCPDGATPENNFKQGALSKAEAMGKAIPVPVKRGQTAFFGGELIHGSSANRSKDRSRRTFIGHYCDGVTDSIAKFYHPVLNKDREVMSQIEVNQGGGPCGGDGGWEGAVH